MTLSLKVTRLSNITDRVKVTSSVNTVRISTKSELSDDLSMPRTLESSSVRVVPVLDTGVFV